MKKSFLTLLLAGLLGAPVALAQIPGTGGGGHGPGLDNFREDNEDKLYDQRMEKRAAEQAEKNAPDGGTTNTDASIYDADAAADGFGMEDNGARHGTAP